MGDLGKLLGDDMKEGDMVALDGMGFGGEFRTDTDDVDMSSTDAELNFEAAVDDGMEPDNGSDIGDGVDSAIDMYGMDDSELF